MRQDTGSLASRFDAGLKAKGISRTAAANHLMVSARTVSHLATGARSPKPQTLLLMAQVIDESVEYLVEGGDRKAACEAENKPFFSMDDAREHAESKRLLAAQAPALTELSDEEVSTRLEGLVSKLMEADEPSGVAEPVELADEPIKKADSTTFPDILGSISKGAHREGDPLNVTASCGTACRDLAEDQGFKGLHLRFKLINSVRAGIHAFASCWRDGGRS